MTEDLSPEAGGQEEMRGSVAAAVRKALSTGRFYSHETPPDTEETGTFSERGKPGDLLPADLP